MAQRWDKAPYQGPGRPPRARSEDDSEDEPEKKPRHERTVRDVPEDRPDRPCASYSGPAPSRDPSGRGLCLRCGWEQYPHGVRAAVDVVHPGPPAPKRKRKGRASR